MGKSSVPQISFSSRSWSSWTSEKHHWYGPNCSVTSCCSRHNYHTQTKKWEPTRKNTWYSFSNATLNIYHAISIVRSCDASICLVANARYNTPRWSAHRARAKFHISSWKQCLSSSLIIPRFQPLGITISATDHQGCC